MFVDRKTCMVLFFHSQGLYFLGECLNWLFILCVAFGAYMLLNVKKETVKMPSLVGDGICLRDKHTPPCFYLQLLQPLF